MNFDSLKQKAADLAKDEETTDSALDKAAEAASKATGGKFDEQIQQGRDMADKKLGTE